MIKRRLIIIMIFLLLFPAFSCGRNTMPAGEFGFSVIVPQGAGITEEDVKKIFLRNTPNNPASPDRAEIIILGYSSGKETFTFSDNTGGSVQDNTMDGSMEVLIKIKRNNRLVDSIYLEATGGSKEEILLNMAERIKKTLGP